jgi:hypothetical protein
MNISMILKWTVLVWLNAAVSFFLVVSDNHLVSEIAGMTFAVFTFVGIYACIDQYLLNQQKTELRTQLLWGVALKALTQFAPMIEIATGSVSLQIVTNTITMQIPFVSHFVATMIDGVLLSLFVLLLMMLVRLVRAIFNKDSWR